MAAGALIDRLDFVKPAGRNKWLARCPAHDDRSPSLSITEGEDGRTLIYCFAGCGSTDILAAVGLDYSALFPADDHYTPKSEQAAIERLTTDQLVIEIWDAERAKNLPIKPGDIERYELAISRLKGVSK